MPCDGEIAAQGKKDCAGKQAASPSNARLFPAPKDVYPR